MFPVHQANDNGSTTICEVERLSGGPWFCMALELTVMLINRDPPPGWEFGWLTDPP